MATKRAALVALMLFLAAVLLPEAVLAGGDGQAAGYDLSISGLVCTTGNVVFAGMPNTVHVYMIKNNGPGQSPRTDMEVQSSDGFAGRAIVPALDSGNYTSVSITDPTLRSAAGTTVTYTATLDPDGLLPAANRSGYQKTSSPLAITYNGFAGKRYWGGGSDVGTVKAYDLRGGLVYSFGNSTYVSGRYGAGPWNQYLVNWTPADLSVPAGATVRAAFLYVPYARDDANVSPGHVHIDFNGQEVSYDYWYHDQINFGAYPDHVYGLLTYNVTSQYRKNADNVAVFTRDGDPLSNISTYGFTLAVVYEDANATRKQVFLNQEFDLLGADIDDYGTNSSEATAYVPFTGMTIDTINVTHAYLTTFVPSGSGPEGNLTFNGNIIGTNVWDYGASYGPQVAVDTRDVGGLLNADDNVAGIQSTPETTPVMAAAQSYLVVEYVNDLPSAAFSANRTSGNVSLPVQFTDASTGSPTSWAWDFGDGSNSTLQSPAHVYTTPGVYTVSLTVTNATGSNTSTRQNYIAAGPLPDLMVFFTQTNGNAGGVLFEKQYNKVQANILNYGTANSTPTTVRIVSSDGLFNATADVPVVVPDKTAGHAKIIYFVDNAVRPGNVTVTYTAIVDPDNIVPDPNRANNVKSSVAKTTVYNGYDGKRFMDNGSDVNTVRAYDLRGGIISSFGDSYYHSGMDTSWTGYTANWTTDDLPLPPGATVREARLYLEYCWDNSNVAPNKLLVAFNGQNVSYESWYADVSNFGGYSNYVYGMLTYNVTSLFRTGVNNTVYFERLQTPSKISPAGFCLVVVYDDPAATRKQIFLNEEFDALGADPSSYGNNETLATAYVPFTGMAIDVANVSSANLTTFVPWGAGADGPEGNLYFNGIRLQHDVWSYGNRVVGESDSAQIAVDTRDVKAYLNATGNVAAIQSTEEATPLMVAAQDYLVVEYASPADNHSSFGLSLKRGWNLVSSPLVVDPPLNVSVFKGTNVTMAAQYNRTTGGFDIYRVGKTPTAFPFEAGQGYFLYCNNDTSYTVNGLNETGQPAVVYRGWNMIGWTNMTGSNAKLLADSLHNVTMLARYDTATGTYDIYRAGKTPTPFNITAGEGYFLYTTYDEPQTLP